MEIMREVFDADFIMKYYGTTHRTGIKFYSNTQRAEVRVNGCILDMLPGDVLVTCSDGRYVVPGKRYP